MTDPIAEAAANLNASAQPAQGTDPSIFDEIKDTIHDLQEKVEHLIHPEAASEPQSAGGESTEAPGTTASSAEAGGTQAVSQEQSITQETASLSAAIAPQESPVPGEMSTSTAQPAAQKSTIAPVEEGNAAPTVAGPSSGEHASVAGEQASPDVPGELAISQSPAVLQVADLPNAPASPAASPATSEALSASAVSPGAGAGSGIRTHIANIKSHLAGFEVSTVAKIHGELEAIERML